LPSLLFFDGLVGPDETDLELCRRFRVAEIKRPEARDAKAHVDMRAAIREFKLRLVEERELRGVNASSRSGPMVAPPPMHVTCSIQFRSSRTLPGHR
jgi:hypothetical protein